jgi:hypothetical protein
VFCGLAQGGSDGKAAPAERDRFGRFIRGQSRPSGRDQRRQQDSDEDEDEGEDEEEDEGEEEEEENGVVRRLRPRSASGLVAPRSRPPAARRREGGRERGSSGGSSSGGDGSGEGDEGGSSGDEARSDDEGGAVGWCGAVIAIVLQAYQYLHDHTGPEAQGRHFLPALLPGQLSVQPQQAHGQAAAQPARRVPGGRGATEGLAADPSVSQRQP